MEIIVNVDCLEVLLQIALRGQVGDVLPTTDYVAVCRLFWDVDVAHARSGIHAQPTSVRAKISLPDVTFPSANFFRLVRSRFCDIVLPIMASRTDARLMKSTKFPPEFSKKVDMQKVNLQVMKK